MSRDERVWHPKFIEYMEYIVNHPNYNGLPIEIKRDGTYRWIATAQSTIGKERIEWCLAKANELEIPIQPGVYADVMLAIHPTKTKVCQTCGREMSLYYHYPNATFLMALNKRFNTNYTDCDHISDIWDNLLDKGFDFEDIAEFLISKGQLSLSIKNTTKEEVIDSLEYACRKGNKTCLGPGAMSNFPDRFDGFHTYNRCCRSKQDKGRSKENLRSYTKDRRAYEYWSDGNIHAANQFMGSVFFDGLSADHIGPISLGFVHDSHYLQPMLSGENSAKRDRLQYEDIVHAIEVETRTGICAMSWYSELIWDYIKNNFEENREKISTDYREALKQNMANFMYILWFIMENSRNRGVNFLVSVLLEPKFECFDYTYEFNGLGEIINCQKRHRTERSSNEIDRYCRIAIDSVYDYNSKNNRNNAPDLTKYEMRLLDRLCDKINRIDNTKFIENDFLNLVCKIQQRIIGLL